MRTALFLFAALAQAQTRVNFDQASRLGVAWSEGLRSPRISPTQIATPKLNFSISPNGFTIGGDRQCAVVSHQNKTILVYVVWRKGQLAVLAGGWEWDPLALGPDHSSYKPTLNYVSITGDCISVEMVDHELPPDIQQILFIGISGMPHSSSTFLGACVDSIESYSNGIGEMSVTDFRGRVWPAIGLCSK